MRQMLCKIQAKLRWSVSTSLDVRKFFFSQRVVNEWNLLPQEVVDATSVNQFKNRLDKFRQRYGH